MDTIKVNNLEELVKKVEEFFANDKNSKIIHQYKSSIHSITEKKKWSEVSVELETNGKEIKIFLEMEFRDSKLDEVYQNMLERLSKFDVKQDEHEKAMKIHDEAMKRHEKAVKAMEEAEKKISEFKKNFDVPRERKKNKIKVNNFAELLSEVKKLMKNDVVKIIGNHYEEGTQFDKEEKLIKHWKEKGIKLKNSTKTVYIYSDYQGDSVGWTIADEEELEKLLSSQQSFQLQSQTRRSDKSKPKYNTITGERLEEVTTDTKKTNDKSPILWILLGTLIGVGFSGIIYFIAKLNKKKK